MCNILCWSIFFNLQEAMDTTLHKTYVHI
jgi:hypothetical protein